MQPIGIGPVSSCKQLLAEFENGMRSIKYRWRERGDTGRKQCNIIPRDTNDLCCTYCALRFRRRRRCTTDDDDGDGGSGGGSDDDGQQSAATGSRSAGTAVDAACPTPSGYNGPSCFFLSRYFISRSVNTNRS